MSFRTIVITKRCKLDLKLGYLVVRDELETTKIYINEISTLILESTAISITTALLCELTKNKINIIFCDEKRNPLCEISSYYSSHNSSLKIKNQINWDLFIKQSVWTEIVLQKIKNQKYILQKYGFKECELLDDYLKDMQFYDTTNREGHSAKVYFNALFGKDFSRAQNNNINAALNYGYNILLSSFNRGIISNGYITQLGIFHDNMFNKFNLSCDLMEPFRVIIDECIFNMNLYKFEKDEKMQIVNLLNKEIIIERKTHYLNNAIKIYCKSVLDAISEKDISLIKFIEIE